MTFFPSKLAQFRSPPCSPGHNITGRVGLIRQRAIERFGYSSIKINDASADVVWMAPSGEGEHMKTYGRPATNIPNENKYMWLTDLKCYALWSQAMKQSTKLRSLRHSRYAVPPHEPLTAPSPPPNLRSQLARVLLHTHAHAAKSLTTPIQRVFALN